MRFAKRRKDKIMLYWELIDVAALINIIISLLPRTLSTPDQSGQEPPLARHEKQTNGATVYLPLGL